MTNLKKINVNTAEVGVVRTADVPVGDPQKKWEPGTVEQYVDNVVATETARAQDAEAALQARSYAKSDTYTKTEVNGLVDTPHQNYVTVETYAALTAINPGSADTIYRVCNYDGSTSTVDATKYSEYAWNGTAYVFLCVKSQIDEVFDITVYNSNTKYDTLADALGTGGEHIPATLRRGGMSVKYVHTSDNKYVQFRYMGTDVTGNPNPFLDTANWQGVDDEPTAESDNLVKSGAVFEISNKLDTNLSEDEYVDCFGQGSVVGPIAYDGQYLSNGSWTTYYIPVKKGETYRGVAVGNSNNRVAFSTAVPADGVSNTDFHEYGSESAFAQATFTAPYDGYLGVSRETSRTTSFKFQLKNKGLAVRIKALEDEDLDARLTDVETDMAEVKDDVDSLNETLYNDDEWIVKQSSSKVNPIAYPEKYLENPSYTTYYISCKQGDKIKVVSVGYDNNLCAFSLVEPAVNVAVTGYELVTESVLTTKIFTAPYDGYFGISRETSKTTSMTFYKKNDGIGIKVDGMYNYGKDAAIVLPDYLFLIDNVADNQNTRSQSIKVEGLLSKKRDLSINGGHKVNIHPTSTQHYVVKNNSGNELASKDVNVITTSTSVIENKQIRLLAIGDSWCGANLNDLDGQAKGGWNYQSCALEDYMKICIDASLEPNMINIGSNWSGLQRNAEYKGQTFSIKTTQEGRGGWSGQVYLRHPVLVREYTDLCEKAAWDAIGLGRKIPYVNTYDESAQYSNYVQDVSHITEILTTAMGYYHWDYSTELMNWCGITGTYSGTTEQKNAIDAYMENILNNPVNPFYDWATAKSTEGEYAFNFSTYLSRYKTLEDDGVTRLVVGSTAGSKITNTLIDIIDLCTPTHVTIELGVNDFAGLTETQRANDLKQIAELIMDYDSSIKVGIVPVHIPGAFYPAKWENAIYNELDSWFENRYYSETEGLFGLKNKLEELLPTPSKTGITIVPTYYTMGVSNVISRYVTDVYGNKVLMGGSDGLHPGIDVHREIGYQILSWILYTLS